MNRPKGVGMVFLSLFLLVFGLNSFKRTVSAVPSGAILIGQAKITSSNGQFISLYNNTNSEIDMSTVQLAYYNYYDLTSTKLTSSRYIPLSGKLASHSYYMVSDGALVICYKMTVNAISLGFSSTAGTVQVTQNGPNNVLDSLAWSKTAVAGSTTVQILPTSTSGFLQRAWVDGLAKGPGDPWINVTPVNSESCDLQTQIASSSTPVAPIATGVSQTVKTVAATTSDVPANQNLGLVAPELTELLPNPKTPQTDDADEYIELYNPNNSVFNLTGYRLEAGTSYSRGYTFTSGSLNPKSYTAFKITDTNLQLSNSEGQVRLLSPDGTTISETPGYEDAPEGESWSLVSDSWQWSNITTPNQANQPSAATAASTKTASAKAVAAKKTSNGKVAGAATNSPNYSPTDLNDAAPLHPLVLAGVGLAAVAYACYEYRKDMANQIFKLRRYFRNRREVRIRG